MIPPREHLHPITRARLESTLTTLGYRTEVGHEGSLVRTSDGWQFTVAVLGDAATVRVRGTSPRTIDTALAPGIAQVVNDWNRDRIWPKVFTRPHGTGLRLHTDVTAHLEGGASDAQLSEVIACGLGTGATFFAAIGDLLAGVLDDDGRDRLPPFSGEDEPGPGDPSAG